jgi:hypothetical protein
MTLLLYTLKRKCRRPILCFAFLDLQKKTVEIWTPCYKFAPCKKSFTAYSLLCRTLIRCLVIYFHIRHTYRDDRRPTFQRPIIEFFNFVVWSSLCTANRFSRPTIDATVHQCVTLRYRIDPRPRAKITRALPRTMTTNSECNHGDSDAIQDETTLNRAVGRLSSVCNVSTRIYAYLSIYLPVCLTHFT